MHFMQTESVLQTKNRSEPTKKKKKKKRFSVALGSHPVRETGRKIFL